jgi:hypothetical protein
MGRDEGRHAVSSQRCPTCLDDPDWTEPKCLAFFIVTHRVGFSSLIF